MITLQGNSSTSTYTIAAAVATGAYASLDASYKPASDFTKAEIAESDKNLNFSNYTMYEEVDCGFVVAPNTTRIMDTSGENVAIDSDAIIALAQFLARTGVYRVQDKVYQVRGMDLATMTIIEAPEGLIVVNLLGSSEPAKIAFELYMTHESFINGSIQVVAPLNFVEEALSENYMVAGSMFRRAFYMYGNLIKPHAQGSIHAGLAFGAANSQFGFVAPTISIDTDLEHHTMAGLDFEFMLTLSPEAPSEFHFFVPELKLLNTGENVVMGMHNCLTPRGAKEDLRSLWLVENMIGQHHWPKYGNAAVVEHLENYRDTIKFPHNQAVRLLKLGLGMEEISETIELPASLDSNFSTRGHYGHLKHNSKEVYQFYVGWWDGKPATYQQLPPVERAQQYAADMGGNAEVRKRGEWHRDNENYRYCAKIMNHAVFNDPTDMAAKYLEADCLEQIGYSEESGPRRNYMQTGSEELRHGKGAYPPADLGPSFVLNMPLYMLLQGLEIRINPEQANKAHGLSILVGVEETNEMLDVRISNAVMLSLPITDMNPRSGSTANFTAKTRSDLIAALVTENSSLVSVTGDIDALKEFASCISTDEDATWNVMTPRDFYEPKPQKTYPASLIQTLVAQTSTAESSCVEQSCLDQGLSVGAVVGVAVAALIVGLVGGIGVNTIVYRRKNNACAAESTTDLG
ncbi:hypothetical protein SARC_00883 [Sphaeroforma arctica JP610]|uniref:Uncharacterized protein n=1 Tax=Sphaeroforma arctica JP610 TaxID=667725 RepID=A0A0L0GDA5_9EUKA|nr:hypothetical protein SARC_00883 [Sphaeroforma arctica JP610]KNC86990.1 hypothetical protein SARC_00883 [Sphaeroforma arctica JP610]|eukprot:XP_014160892.1 hypothetical protein SARC_00883 [Sphaeroforma arctica JP610]